MKRSHFTKSLIMKCKQFTDSIGEGGRYLIVGGITTLINLIIYQVFLWFNVSYMIATTFAFVGSVIFAFFANKFYVFDVVTSNSTWFELTMFIGSRMSTFLVETVGLFVLISGFGLKEMISKIMMNVIVILLNYIISKFWIFKGEKRENI